MSRSGSFYFSAALSAIAVLLVAEKARPQAPAAVPIHVIQGSGSVSPLRGQNVATTGIVTARKSNGLFIQAPDSDADSDPSSSEGILVFTSSAPPAVAAIGSRVQVSGVVTEYVPSSDPSSPPLTEITSPAITVLSTGNALPEPVALAAENTKPDGGLEQLERFEGMRVRVDRLLVIAPTDGTYTEQSASSRTNGVFYGVIEGVARPFREPGVRVPDPLPAGSPPFVPRYDGNPERIRVDSDAQTGAQALEVASGMVVHNLTGPLEYGFRTYTIDPDLAPLPQVSRQPSFVPVPAPSPDEFTVGAINLQRFFDTENDPATADPILTEGAFNHRLSKASLSIRRVLSSPDILGVMEAENLGTLESLAARLNDDSVAEGLPDPRYKAWLEEGNDPGGIDVGFLVKTSHVTVVGVAQEGKDATYINPSTGRPDILNDRPPLVLRAIVSPPGVRQGFPLTVIVNHLRSLTDIDNPTSGARVRAKRLAGAEFLANLILARQTAAPAEDIVAIGDFNSYPFSDGYVDVSGIAKGSPAAPDQVVLASTRGLNPQLRNLIDLLPPDQRYSYVYDGDAQVLDHVLVNRNLLPRATRIAFGRSNADFPESLRNDPNRPERLGDHDGVVAYFTAATAAPQLFPAGVTNAASFDSGPVAPGLLVTVFGFGFGPLTPASLELTADGRRATTVLANTRVLFDGHPAPMIYSSSGQVVAVVPYRVAQQPATRLHVEYKGVPTNVVTVPVEATSPGLFSADSSGLGQGAVLNEDGSVNSPARPAVKGSIAVLYVTGAGETEPPGTDGEITGSQLPQPRHPVSVKIGGVPAEVLYAGAAPGLVSGIMQINVRVPLQVIAGDSVPLIVSFGSGASGSRVTMAIR